MAGFVRGSSESWDLEIEEGKGIKKWDVKTPMIPVHLQPTAHLSQDAIDESIARDEASSINKKQQNKGHLKEERSDISILLDTSYITPAIRDKIFAILAADYEYTEAQLATIHELRY